MFLRPTIILTPFRVDRTKIREDRFLLWGENSEEYLTLWGDEDGYFLLWGEEAVKAWFLYNGFSLDGEWNDEIPF